MLSRRCSLASAFNRLQEDVDLHVGGWPSPSLGRPRAGGYADHEAGQGGDDNRVNKDGHLDEPLFDRVVVSATAAAMVAVMPASLDRDPLIPLDQRDLCRRKSRPAKAPPITLAKKAGIEVTLHTTRIMTSTR